MQRMSQPVPALEQQSPRSIGIVDEKHLNHQYLLRNMQTDSTMYRGKVWSALHFYEFGRLARLVDEQDRQDDSFEP